VFVVSQIDISLADNREPRTKRQRNDRADRDRDRDRDYDRDRDRGRASGFAGRDRKRGRFDEGPSRDFRGGERPRVSGFSDAPPISCQVVFLNPAQRYVLSAQVQHAVTIIPTRIFLPQALCRVDPPDNV